MAQLRAKKPVQTDKRLKFFLYGPTWSGKSTFLAHFPNSYIIDTENGMDEYANLINNGNSVLLQTSSIQEVNEELDALITTEHPYTTLVIDPGTMLYEDAQTITTALFTKYAPNQKIAETQDFGLRYWPSVKKHIKSLQKKLLRLDMNVVVTSHQKDMYSSSMQKIGVTFDDMKGSDYFFDIIFRCIRNANMMTFIKEKERCEPGADKFEDEFSVDISEAYNYFADKYGRETIERKSKKVELCTQEQLVRMYELIAAFSETRLTPDVIQRVLDKLNIDRIEEMSVEEANQFIDQASKL